MDELTQLTCENIQLKKEQEHIESQRHVSTAMITVILNPDLNTDNIKSILKFLTNEEKASICHLLQQEADKSFRPPRMMCLNNHVLIYFDAANAKRRINIFGGTHIQTSCNLMCDCCEKQISHANGYYSCEDICDFDLCPSCENANQEAEKVLWPKECSEISISNEKLG